MNIFHFCHLDTVGGVERLLSDFLAKQDPSNHCLWVANQHIHPSFQKPLTAFPKFYSKYLWGFKLPKFFRKWKQERIFQNTSPSLLLYWNQTPLLSLPSSLPHSPREIFYDHGSSWYLDPHSKGGKTLERMQALLTCSHASKRMIELKWPQLSAPIHTLPNPLRPGIASACSEGKSLSLHRPLTLGCSGRLIPLKGFICCFHLVKSLIKKGVQVELKIAGTGKDYQALQSASQALGIAKSIHFCAYVEDMPRFFDSLDIFLVPSFREPFGLVALEAQARGLPVIVNAVDGLLETLKEEKTGFTIPPSLSPVELAAGNWQARDLPPQVYYPKKDQLGPPLAPCPEQIAEKILLLIQNPKRYTLMSQQAKKWACQYFSFDAYEKNLNAFLNKMPNHK